MNRLKLPLTFLVLFLMSSCSDLPRDMLVDDIKINVITFGAGFSGYYIVDGDGSKNFESNILTGGFSTYNRNIEILDSLVVAVTTYTGATSVEIKIYRNEELVKENSQTGLTGPVTLNLSYKYNEENNQEQQNP